MRLLIFHVDRFACTATQRGRSALVEQLGERTFVLEQGLLVLAGVEAGDEHDASGVAARASGEVQKLAGQLGVRRAMIHPFAHLFGEPAPVEASLHLLDDLAERLREGGLEVTRTPFGWFFSWELSAKGHPLSRVARRIHPAPEAAP